jgi:hypothetical protein
VRLTRAAFGHASLARRCAASSAVGDLGRYRAPDLGSVIMVFFNTSNTDAVS